MKKISLAEVSTRKRIPFLKAINDAKLEGELMEEHISQALLEHLDAESVHTIIHPNTGLPVMHAIMPNGDVLYVSPKALSK